MISGIDSVEKKPMNSTLPKLENSLPALPSLNHIAPSPSPSVHTEKVDNPKCIMAAAFPGLSKNVFETQGNILGNPGGA